MTITEERLAQIQAALRDKFGPSDELDELVRGYRQANAELHLPSELPKQLGGSPPGRNLLGYYGSNGLGWHVCRFNFSERKWECVRPFLGEPDAWRELPAAPNLDDALPFEVGASSEAVDAPATAGGGVERVTKERLEYLRIRCELADREAAHGWVDEGIGVHYVELEKLVAAAERDLAQAPKGGEPDRLNDAAFTPVAWDGTQLVAQAQKEAPPVETKVCPTCNGARIRHLGQGDALDSLECTTCGGSGEVQATGERT